MSVLGNLEEIKKNISNACNSVGRKPEDVKILAVTKTRTPEVINEAINLGLIDIGENRVQELLSKYEYVDKRARWHIIGHLQTNKVKYIADKVIMIHSVDSVKLAKEIDLRCGKLDKVMDILIEINSGEESKSGILPNKVFGLIDEIYKLKHIHICGLMTMAPREASSEELHKVFSALYNLSVDISKKKYDNISMDCLSMGMSNDYKIAVCEGSTIIRPGRSLFD